MKIDFTIIEEFDGRKAEAFLRYCGVSAGLLKQQKQINLGIQRNGELLRTVDIVYKGDKIILNLPEEKNTAEPNEKLAVPIVYEDEYVIVFDKPYNMPTHTSQLHYTDTLANYFAFLYPDRAFRAVIRLDKDTSGLVVVAKNVFAAAFLQGNINKIYYAVCEGRVEEHKIIELPIAREKESIIKRCVSENGQYAKTEYFLEKYADNSSFIKIKLYTGRTHQIRVHLAYTGHPLCGDDMYGGSLKKIQRQALHCGELEFISPFTHKKTVVKSNLPQDMQELLK